MIESVYKKEIAYKLGISFSTFQRKLKSVNLDVPRGLIPPLKQKEIYTALGYSNIWEAKEREIRLKNR